MTKKIKLMLLLIATLLPATMFGDWRDFTYTANGVTWKCSVWADGDKATIKGENFRCGGFCRCAEYSINCERRYEDIHRGRHWWKCL